MKGNILGFDADINVGAISGHDGGRYEFVRLDWRGPTLPRTGDTVDFIADGGRATQIYPLLVRGDPIQGNAAEIIYILYLVSLFVGITGIVGLIMAYVNKAEAPAWVQTHYRMQIRTFWIGLLYFFVGLVTAILVVGVLLWIFTFIWWIVRCAKGLKALSQGEPYPGDPATWLW